MWWIGVGDMGVYIIKRREGRGRGRREDGERVQKEREGKRKKVTSKRRGAVTVARHGESKAK